MYTSVAAAWLGHSAFRLETPSGTVIYIDPFLSGNPTSPDAFKNPDDADFILLTHGHEDHVGDSLEIAERCTCKVVSIVELSHLLKKHGLDEDLAIEFNKGGTVHFDDFSVTLTSANHSSSFGGEYAGDPGGLVVTFNDDDLIFYHLGDTNLFYDLELYAELYDPDVIAVPMGDYYTMGPAEAALACEMLGADYAVPVHFGTFPVLTGTPEEFKTHTEDICDTEVLIPKAGENFLADL